MTRGPYLGTLVRVERVVQPASSALGPSSAHPTLKAIAKLGLKGKIFMATFDLSPEISAGIKDGTVAFRMPGVADPESFRQMILQARDAWGPYLKSA